MFFYIISRQSWHLFRYLNLAKSPRIVNSISKNEFFIQVNAIETFLAENASMNQASKSFCPRSLYPDCFVTFIWDNNDINPESLKGGYIYIV